MSRATSDITRVLGSLLFHSFGERHVHLGKKEHGDNLKTLLRKWPPVTQMLGVTGCGKSKLIVMILMQFVLLCQPFTVIDPTGSLVRSLVPFIAELCHYCEMACLAAKNDFERQFHANMLSFIKERLIVLDFSGEHGDVEWTFNPLYYNPARGETPEEISEYFIRSISKMYGDIKQMRRMGNVLGATAAIASEEGETLFRILELVKLDQSGMEKCVNRLYEKAQKEGRSKPYCGYHINMVHDLIIPTKGRERRDLIQSTLNALNVFLKSRVTRDFINCRGDESNSIDFYDVVNSGKIVLVHAPSHDRDCCRVMSNMIVTRIEQEIFRRSAELRNRQYILAIDEAGLVVDQGFAEAAGIIRQYGLRILWAAQSSNQPPFGTSREGKSIFDTLVSQSWSKIIFRLDIEDARRFAPYIHLAKGEMERKKYEEVTETKSVSLGQTVGQKTSFEVQSGFDFAEEQRESRRDSVALGVEQGQQREIGIAQESGESHSVTSEERRTTSEENRSTTSSETSTHQSSTSTFSQDRTNSSSSSNQRVSGNSYAHQMIDDDQNSRRTTHRRVKNEESGSKYSEDTTQATSERRGENHTSGTSSSTRQGSEVAHIESQSVGRSEGFEKSSSVREHESLRNTEANNIRRGLSVETSSSQSTTQRQGVAFRMGEETSDSKQQTYGAQTRHVGGFLSHDQEIEIAAQWLYTQQDRQAFVIQKPSTEFVEGQLAEGQLNVVQIQTHTLGDEFLEHFYQKNLVESLLEAASPERRNSSRSNGVSLHHNQAKQPVEAPEEKQTKPEEEPEGLDL